MHFPSHLQEATLQGGCFGLFVPDAKAVREAYEKGLIPFPYWSRVWPAAKALAQFLLVNPSLVQAKTVLEIGAGLGLPSLVAAPQAASVLCTDYVDTALQFVAQSAAHHRLSNFRTAVLDWQHLPEGVSADVLLLSDINYEPVTFNALLNLIASFLQARTTIILSTPQRLMAKEFIAPLLKQCTRQEEIVVWQDEKEHPITVFILQQKGFL